METNFIDLHCHPAMKALGKSFNKHSGVNSSKPSETNSIWFYDPPTVADKAANIVTTLTKFRQSDFTTLMKGGADIIFISLKGLEKGFVMTRLGVRDLGDIASNLVTGIGQDRIDYIQKMDNYFNDLELEYKFYCQLEGQEFTINGQRCMYKIISSFDEIEQEPNPTIKTIYLILTIEGVNVFNSGLQMMGKIAKREEILENLDKVKAWPHRLFFMGMAHHFYNEQCGHAKSLNKFIGFMCNQKDGIDTSFTDIGLEVLHRLLDNSNGKRVLIDLKHMSLAARQDYYNILEKEYKNENIPLIVSHGAVNGLKSFEEPFIVNNNTAGKFQEEDINFFDNEICRIASSRGIFGIQLDERRLASKSELKKSKGSLERNRMLFKKSKLVWNQIQHIAEVLDQNNQFAWDIQAIGSDNDGMVNPLNGFWTSEDMGLLASYLEKHAYNYIGSTMSENLKPYNRTTASEIVNRLMHDNAYEFVKRNLS